MRICSVFAYGRVLYRLSVYCCNYYGIANDICFNRNCFTAFIRFTERLVNTALLPQALRKISRLYFNSLHKVIVKQIMLYDDRIEIQFNAPIKVSPDSDESRRGFSLCSKTVKLTI